MAEFLMIDSQEDIPESEFDKALMLKGMVTALATGESLDEERYQKIRSNFLSTTHTKNLLPRFVKTCRETGSLWAYLKNVQSNAGAYNARRQHINDEFAPLLDFLESADASPSDAGISDALSRYDNRGVQAAWTKALDRRSSDPQGAITSARTLLEEVCKHILEEAGVQPSEKWDLPKLYSETSKTLNLAPSQHTEETFKSILGGCSTIVTNLGALRNKISDAHGLGKRQIKPAPRHATLAVNLAGVMSMFLIETWLDRGAAN